MAHSAQALIVLLTVFAVGHAVLVLPKIPPRGFNSFDLQYDRRSNPSIGIWNESYFRRIAPAMARQLLPAGCKPYSALLKPCEVGPALSPHNFRVK